MKRAVLVVLALLLSASVACAQPKDPVFDLEALNAPPLKPRVLKTSEDNGIVTEEVMFYSHEANGKPVEIFAFLVYPKGAKSLPAFIWNQGGLGKANTHLITHYGAKRGYAAMCIDFPMPGYRSTGDIQIVSGVAITDDPKQAPIYHGAVALIRAVTYLQSRPEVNKDKIGMTGSSWGGFYTTLMAGIDPRIKVGSSMFGSGHHDLGSAWWGPPGSERFPSQAQLDHWMKTLDPAFRLKTREVPVGWFTGTNDMFYWLNAVSLTYEEAKGPKHLAFFPNWAHGLPPHGDTEVFEFLDVHLKGAPPLIAVSPLTTQKRDGKAVATFTFKAGSSFTAANAQETRVAKSCNVLLSYGGFTPGNWLSRYWKTIPGKIEGNTCTVELPASPLPYVISGSVVDGDRYVSSTALVAIDEAKLKELGLHDPKATIEYNAAADWGDYEEQGFSYLRGHAFAGALQPSADAKVGKQSASLAGGEKGATHPIYPLWFTGGLPHRLSFWAKADKAAQVSLQFTGNAASNAKPQAVEVGTDWKRVSTDITPADLPNGGLQLHIAVPAGVTVLIDDVRFEPAMSSK